MKKILWMLAALLMLSGCSAVISDDTGQNDKEYQFSFPEEDYSYSLNGSTCISLGDETIRISKAGTYILQGKLNGSIIIDAPKKSKVQLVLDNVEIASGDFAGIYVVEAGEVIISLAEGSVNKISDSGIYTQIDKNDVDALIFSKADLTIEGTGTLQLASQYNHGIVSKDDLIILNGNYEIDVAGKAISGKDCVRIKEGSYVLHSLEDAISSDNDTEEGRGYVYIAGGDFTIDCQADGISAYRILRIDGGSFQITASKGGSADSYKPLKSSGDILLLGGNHQLQTIDDGIHADGSVTIMDGSYVIVSNDDGIHADGMVRIDGGTFEIEASEGIEATYILINGSTISISASDDGMNATTTSNSYSSMVEINDGQITIVMGQGDTDGIDANGSIYVNGGTVDITGQFPFDYDDKAEHNGGTIIVNGVETDEITNQFQNGGPGQGGGMPFGWGDGGHNH